MLKPTVAALGALALGLAVFTGAAMGKKPVQAGKKGSCLGMTATIVGTQRADIINGTPGADVIVARGGKDQVWGHGG
ncbi:MAG TPA: hypothetical protein VFM13_00955, partial [Gaiellaceae bacterium]|nr:hypothetical protein [Gaiellaceae bacterium]